MVNILLGKDTVATRERAHIKIVMENSAEILKEMGLIEISSRTGKIIFSG